MIHAEDFEDEEYHVLITLKGSNIEPIRCCPTNEITYNGEDYMGIPLQLIPEETFVTVLLPKLLHDHLQYVKDPRVSVVLISCPFHDKVLARLDDLHLNYCEGYYRLYQPH